MKNQLSRWAAGAFVVSLVAAVVFLLWYLTDLFGLWTVPAIAALIVVPWVVGWVGDKIFDHYERSKK